MGKKIAKVTLTHEDWDRFEMFRFLPSIPFFKEAKIVEWTDNTVTFYIDAKLLKKALYNIYSLGRIDADEQSKITPSLWRIYLALWDTRDLVGWLLEIWNMTRKPGEPLART